MKRSAAEDYLKALYALSESGGAATVGQIAARLKVSAPSVTNMMKRLHALSESLVRRLDELLGHPDTDPHGEPIPRG